MTMSELERLCEEATEREKAQKAGAKKYKMKTIRYSSYPEMYNLTKGWLNDQGIEFEERRRYSDQITYELTLYQVAELVEFLHKYSANERDWEIEV